MLFFHVFPFFFPILVLLFFLFLPFFSLFFFVNSTFFFQIRIFFSHLSCPLHESHPIILTLLLFLGLGPARFLWSVPIYPGGVKEYSLNIIFKDSEALRVLWFTEERRLNEWVNNFIRNLLDIDSVVAMVVHVHNILHCIVLPRWRKICPEIVK